MHGWWSAFSSTTSCSACSRSAAGMPSIAAEDGGATGCSGCWSRAAGAGSPARALRSCEERSDPRSCAADGARSCCASWTRNAATRPRASDGRLGSSAAKGPRPRRGAERPHAPTPLPPRDWASIALSTGRNARIFLTTSRALVSASWKRKGRGSARGPGSSGSAPRLCGLRPTRPQARPFTGTTHSHAFGGGGETPSVRRAPRPAPEHAPPPGGHCHGRLGR